MTRGRWRSGVHTVLLGAAAQASLIPACSFVFGYPDGQREASVERCDDGIDNDFDGLVDCDQPSCDGYCAEQESGRCADGRDNDGDGFMDAKDPGCWPDRPPAVDRSVSRDAASFLETFDAPLSAERWYPFGSVPGSGTSVAQQQWPASRQDSPDRVLGFDTKAPEEGVLGGIATRFVLDGDFSRLVLRFEARLETAGLARVALVPYGLAPEGIEPTEGALTASVVLELDGRDTPTLSLLANHGRASIPWGAADTWHSVSVMAEDDALVARVDDAEARLPRPAITASRLVVWGEARSMPTPTGAVQLDDLRLNLGATQPAGAAVPEIPLGRSCRLDPGKLAADVGHTVSVVAGAQDLLCAVVTSAPPGAKAPSAAQSWHSATGADWEQGGLLPVSADGLAGAAVAFDGTTKQYRAAVLAPSAAGVELLLFRSDDCADWSGVNKVQVLPADSESPSYIVPGAAARHEVYFTRPPSEEAGRTLWRLQSADGEQFGAPVQVSEFPNDLDVHDPVSISRAGAGDLVAVASARPTAGVSGLRILVATAGDPLHWRLAGEKPAVLAGTHPGEFDSFAIVSGALLWNGEGGILLQGARGDPFPHASVPPVTGLLTTGTARLRPDGSGVPSVAPVPAPEQCGNGQCLPPETCEECPVDCRVCDGDSELTDRFDSTGDWQAVVPGWAGAAPAYRSATTASLHLEPSHAGWMALPLSAPLQGDFELSFDVHVVADSAEAELARCTAYVGVARLPTTTAMVPEGVFAQVDQQLPGSGGGPVFSTRVKVGEKVFSSLASCSVSDGCEGATTGMPERSHHVVIRKEAGRASIRVLGADGCEIAPRGENGVSYVGALQTIDSVVAGWGGVFGDKGWATSCPDGTAAMRVDNLVLRHLPCATGTATCDPGNGSQAVCVNLQDSPEHCGACFAAVNSAQGCMAGEPVCHGASCPGASPGEPVCVDLDWDDDNCGVCGKKLGPLERCFQGLRTALVVQTPKFFGIDSTEVTRAQYADWLAGDPPVHGQSPACEWNSSFEPQCAWPPGDRGNWPVTCVDWCDAYAYCKAVGKRLCGKIGGGAAQASGSNSQSAQWYDACSSGDTNLYPYGETFDGTACMGAANPGANCIPVPGTGVLCETAPVASLPSCQSAVPGYAGVYDLSGNAQEYIDSCDGNTDMKDKCGAWGGAPDGKAATMRCKSLVAWPRWQTAYDLGFRCCAL